MICVRACYKPFREFSKDSRTIIVTFLCFKGKTTITNAVNEIGQVDGALHVGSFVDSFNIQELGGRNEMVCHLVDRHTKFHSQFSLHQLANPP